MDSTDTEINVPYETDWEFVSYIIFAVSLLCFPVLISLF